jgi:hypothetical protein
MDFNIYAADPTKYELGLCEKIWYDLSKEIGPAFDVAI